MMEWFKMQTIWGAGISRLSDAEAGRFIKAVFAYVRDGEEYNGTGKEDLLVAQATETLRNDLDVFQNQESARAAKKAALAEKRKAAALARWNAKAMQNDANASTAMQVDASALPEKQVHDFAGQNKNKNKTQKENENSTKRNGETRAREEKLPDGFERFWEAYPRKMSKQEAVKAFERIKPDAMLIETMVKAVLRQRLSAQWKKDNGQFIPLPSTWLNQHRWEDEMPAAQSTGKVVNAAKYTQREYTEDELDDATARLMAEAETM